MRPVATTETVRADAVPRESQRRKIACSPSASLRVVSPFAVNTTTFAGLLAAPGSVCDESVLLPVSGSWTLMMVSVLSISLGVPPAPSTNTAQPKSQRAAAVVLQSGHAPPPDGSVSLQIFTGAALLIASLRARFRSPTKSIDCPDIRLFFINA